MQRNHSCTSKIRKSHILANSVMTPYFFMRIENKAEPREVTKQVVWTILRNRIFHRTIRHIRSGFPSYARTLRALTLFAYALKALRFLTYWLFTLFMSSLFGSGDLTIIKRRLIVWWLLLVLQETRLENKQLYLFIQFKKLILTSTNSG